MLGFEQCSGFMQETFFVQDVYKVYPSFTQGGSSHEIQVGSWIPCQVIIVTII